MHKHFEQTPSPASFPSRFPVFALDRIWVKPRSLLRTMKVHASSLARVASDHLPLTAELSLECGGESGTAALLRGDESLRSERGIGRGDKATAKSDEKE
jgi:hypothetical protein